MHHADLMSGSTAGADWIVADLLGVSKRTVESEWTAVRAWLRRELSNGDES